MSEQTLAFAVVVFALLVVIAVAVFGAGFLAGGIHLPAGILGR